MSSAREAVEMRKQIALAHAALHPDFKAEIDKLEKLISEWDKRNSLDDREKALAAKTQAAESRVASLNASVSAKETDLKNREAALVTGKQQLDAMLKKSIDGEASRQAAHNAAMTELQAKTKAVAESSAALEKERLAVKSIQDELRKREVTLGQNEDRVKAAMSKLTELVK